MEWISVKDRLPEEFQEVLAWFESDASFYCIDRYCIWIYGDPPSFRTERYVGKVTHWMPLPKPPEE